MWVAKSGLGVPDSISFTQALSSAIGVYGQSISSAYSNRSSALSSAYAITTNTGDVKSAIEELRAQGVKIHRDIVDREAGKNAIVLDPDDYLVSLFEPTFSDKDTQTAGYHGFTPA